MLSGRAQVRGHFKLSRWDADCSQEVLQSLGFSPWTGARSNASISSIDLQESSFHQSAVSDIQSARYSGVCLPSILQMASTRRLSWKNP
jgi:hypothetical protein